MMGNRELYINLVNRIAEFIGDKTDGSMRQLVVGHDKDYVVTVRAVKKKKPKQAAEKTFIDEFGTIPYVAFSNDELKGMLGDTIKCPHCGGEHKISNKDDYGNPTIMSHYTCGDKTYMCGINGRAI